MSDLAKETAKEVIERLRILDIEGWMEGPELEWLCDRGRESPNAIEIGTFMGRSACAIMAGQRLVQAIQPRPKLLCVDTFDGAGTCRAEEIAKKPPGWLREQFQTNATARGLDDFDITAESSRRAAGTVVAGWDFLFIDACHEYEAVLEDLRLWVPKVQSGGIVSGHDYHHSWPGVVRAVDEFFSPKKVENPVGGIWSIRV